ncbi:hypothetical protein [Bacteroides acidifaciens]|uniref:hypothetical protein n=1 Tax=Bacteroides acidifaciens TaxID=85831 RepID=UPI0025A61DF2|nr:hypothetical protein [Bacteroides acidifaciens]
MINRTITSYTILNYFSEKGISQIDLYVPFACKCINKNASQTVSIEDLKKWFSEEYGLSKIYQGVFVSLLKKMTSLGILSLGGGCYNINKQQLIKEIEKFHEIDNSSSIEELCQKLILFSKENFGVEFSIEETQNGILRFLENHDGDIILDEKGLIDRVARQTEKSKKLNYILSKFIIWSKDNSSETFQLFKNIAKGHALSSLLSMKGVCNYVGKMSGVTIALDSPIIFNLLSLNEKVNFDMSSELLGILKKQGCDFIIFKQHYQEVLQTFNSTIHLLYTKDYSLDKASRLLKYAVRNNISASFLKSKRELLDSILSKWNISICEAPSIPNRYSEIDSVKLNELLMKRYLDNNVEIDDNKRKTIENDVDVISYIYRMRGNSPASNLKNCNAILITTNTALAYASKHPELSNVCHSIPVCMTDAFLSTILWFCYPDTSSDINEKVLLSECYNNLSLSDEILHRFYSEVKELDASTPISEEIMLNINTSRMVQELLESKTFNETSLYTDKTTAEILQEIEISRNTEIKTLSGTLDNHDTKFLSIAKIAAGTIIFFVWLGLVVLFLILKYIDYSNWTNIWKIVLNILSVIPALWGLLSWFGIIKNKAYILDFLTNKIYTIIKTWFDQ